MRTLARADARPALWALAACMLTALAPAGARAEQAAQPASPAAGRLDAGTFHTCAVLTGGSVRCWGYGAEGELGLGDTRTVGDDEPPAAAGPVDLGANRTAVMISAGDFHSCAILDDGSVRCWGFGADGRLGYGSTANVGDDETPAAAGPVRLGAGRTAVAISAGGGHTCAVLDDGSVRCWGFGLAGQLGLGDNRNVGDDETPDSVPTVDLGPGRTAKAIAAGTTHTCALLDDDSVRCWGDGGSGRLGTGSVDAIGDDETPAAIAPVDLGPGRSARALTAGGAHTCAVLDDAGVRCWGFGFSGQLGYARIDNVGDDELPGTVGPVDLEPGSRAVAISAGMRHTCALLAGGAVRCWGLGLDGRLGDAGTANVGDDETPAAIAPVDLGGRAASAIAAGAAHTCALLAGDAVRCWGEGLFGRLGNCSAAAVGDDETPAATAAVDLGPGAAAGAACAAAAPAFAPAAPAALAHSPQPRPAARAVVRDRAGLAAQRRRALALRACLARAARRAGRRRAAGARRCIRRYARTPGRVTGLRARALSRTRIELAFGAPGTDAGHAPPARAYVVKQARHPIRDAGDFRRAQALCHGRCRFAVARVGARASLTIADLRPHTAYYYAVVALDNVSGRRGPRSPTVRQVTR